MLIICILYNLELLHFSIIIKKKRRCVIKNYFTYKHIILINGVSKVCLTSSIKGRPWEGNKKIGRKEHAYPQHVRPSLIKDGWTYWFQAWTILILSYIVRPWPRTDEHIEVFNVHAPRPKRKEQTIIFWSEASTIAYEMPAQIK